MLQSARMSDIRRNTTSDFLGGLASKRVNPMLATAIAAVTGLALLLVAAPFLSGERLAQLGYWALGLALVAVVLVGFVPERGAARPSLRGIATAVGSGLAIGTFFITIDQTSDASGLIPSS